MASNAVQVWKEAILAEHVARMELAKMYSETKATFTIRRQRLTSTAVIRANIVRCTNPVPDTGFLIIPDQKVEFFAAGNSEQYQIGAFQRRANPADSSISKGTVTDGATSFVIEGVGLSQRGLIARYVTDLASVNTNITDADVLSAFRGERPIFDPSAILLPPELHSPFMLENSLMNLIQGYSTLEFNMGGSTIWKLGNTQTVCGAGGGSYLRSNGEPTAQNYYPIPEGVKWMAQGQDKDTQLKAVFEIYNSPVMPINDNTVKWNNAAEAIPDQIYLELQMELVGTAFFVPTGN